MEKFFLYVFYFFLYSAIGWLAESIYCSIAAKKWINRGFLTGPLCPIYGTGATVMLVILEPLKNYPIHVSPFGFEFSITPLLVAIAGMIACDIVEFITSVLMEKLFHARWWDYSNKPFNIQGRICLGHTIYWGLASIGFLYILHPFVNSIISLVKPQILYIILSIIFILFLFDVANAVRNATDLRKAMIKLEKVKIKYLKFMDSLRGTNGAKAKKSNLDEFEKFNIEEEKKQTSDLSSFIEAEKEANRFVKYYPNLKRFGKKQIKSIEELLIELKSKLSDDNDEMY